MRARATALSLLLVGLISSRLSAQQSPVNRSAELAVSDQTLELRYRAPTTIGGQPNSEVAYAAFLSEDRDVVASAELLFGTDFHWGPLQIQLGPRAYAALLSEENNDVFALAIGAQVRYDLVQSRKLAVVGSAFWSPDILTFGSADNLTDFSVRAEMGVADRLIGFVGYRWFTLDLLMTEDRDLQNEIFAGVNWRLQ
jgi:hypothetical protein